MDLYEVASQAMLQQHSAGLRGKYRQAVAAESGEGSTGSSTSNEEEDKENAEMKELRAQIEHYRKQCGGGEHGGQG